MDVAVERVDGFCRALEGGNAAGVVLPAADADLSDSQRQVHRENRRALKQPIRAFSALLRLALLTPTILLDHRSDPFQIRLARIGYGSRCGASLVITFPSR